MDLSYAVAVTLPVAIDLMALAEALDAQEGQTKLVEALKSAWRAQSCLGDLSQAQEICDMLEKLRANSGGIDPNIRSQSEMALLMAAVLNYVRATHTSGGQNERGSIQLGKLTGQQRNDHDILVAIRNGAFGHVLPSEVIDGELWHSQLLLGRQNADHSWSVASATKRLTFHRATLDRLKRQIPVALAAVKVASQKRLDAVARLINDAGPSEQDMLAHAIDPVAIFGSEERASFILGGLPGASLAVWDL